MKSTSSVEPWEAWESDPLHKWSWFVGIFEGEGSTWVTHSGGYTRGYIEIEMTDEDTIRRVQQLLGGRVYSRKPRHDNWKPSWRWQLGAQTRVRSLLLALMRHLSDRRQGQAWKVIRAMDKYEREKHEAVEHGS